MKLLVEGRKHLRGHNLCTRVGFMRAWSKILIMAVDQYERQTILMYGLRRPHTGSRVPLPTTTTFWSSSEMESQIMQSHIHNVISSSQLRSHRAFTSPRTFLPITHLSVAPRLAVLVLRPENSYCSPKFISKLVHSKMNNADPAEEHNEIADVFLAICIPNSRFCLVFPNTFSCRSSPAVFFIATRHSVYLSMDFSRNLQDFMHVIYDSWLFLRCIRRQ